MTRVAKVVDVMEIGIKKGHSASCAAIGEAIGEAAEPVAQAERVGRAMLPRVGLGPSWKLVDDHRELLGRLVFLFLDRSRGDGTEA